MNFSASRSLPQPLFDCILYLTLTQYPYDPGTLPGSADQCILGNVYLRSNLSWKVRLVPFGFETVKIQAQALSLSLL